MILHCDCKHEGQDVLHGSGKRVCNQIKTKSGGVAYRCTVCKKEHTVAKQ